MRTQVTWRTGRGHGGDVTVTSPPTEDANPRDARRSPLGPSAGHLHRSRMKPSLLLLLLLLCGVSSPGGIIALLTCRVVFTFTFTFAQRLLYTPTSGMMVMSISDLSLNVVHSGPMSFSFSGVHIIQWTSGCEWDEETGEVNGFMQNGYDGEDYIALDLKTQTWIASKPQAVVTKLSWDADKGRMKLYDNFITQICPEWLRGYLEYGNKLPSVSLLQKSPSSPVSCHATGFYPDRAVIILPNHDGTFQMSVELHISPVAPEDWARYDCVFQLSGVKEDIVIKLDEAVIRTNLG
uniref:MHC class I-like antigen recognition-like domain-containing protein n=1 Tax=Scophthalmus maximus TaxID=52904 RepID=A0A8D3E291_SCOMX